MDIYGRYKKQNETINNRVYYLKGEFVVFYDGRGHWFVGLESEIHYQVTKGITASLRWFLKVEIMQNNFQGTVI